MGLYLSDLPDRPYEDRRYTANGLSPYLVVNLQEKGGGYTASVVFPYEYYDSESHSHPCYIVHQVELTREGNGWLVDPLDISVPFSDTTLFFFPYSFPTLGGVCSTASELNQDGTLQAIFHAQRISLPGNSTLTGQGYDHMICGFGNNLLSAPDPDAQFETDTVGGFVEVKCFGNAANLEQTDL